MENNTNKKDRKYKYLAFISYRHIKPDSDIAAKVQEEIEKFKVPSEIDPHGNYKDIRVFRDRDELTTKDLSESLDDALLNSKYLIVICSKRTKLSPWCVREVELFKKYHSSRNIIPILIEGEPVDSFSDPLKNLTSVEVDDKGNEVEKSLDLLAADLRPDDVKSFEFQGYENLEKNDTKKLNKYLKDSFKILKTTEIYRIMATILGVNYGDLKQRKKERELKLKIKLSIIAASILTVFAISMTAMFIRAIKSERNAVSQISMMTLKSADQANNDGNRAYALLIANEAMKSADERMENYSELRANYERILNDSLLSNKYSTQLVIKTGNSSPFYDISNDSRFIVSSDQENSASIWSTRSGEKIKNIKFDMPVIAITINQTNNYIYILTSDNNIFEVNPLDYSIKKLDIVTNYKILQIDFTKDQKYFITVGIKKELGFYSSDDFKIVNDFNFNEDIFKIDLIPNKEEFIAATVDGKIERFNFKENKSLEIIKNSSDKKEYIQTSISKNGEIFAYHYENKIYYMEISKGKNSLREIETNFYPKDIILSHDAKKIYLSGISNDIAIFNLEEARYDTFLDLGNYNNVKNISLSNDGSKLILDFDSEMKIGIIENVDKKDGDHSLIISEGSKFDDRIISIKFTDDDKYIISNSQDSTIKVINVENKIASKVIKGNIKAISSDSNNILLVDKNNVMRTYNFNTNEVKEYGEISSVFNTFLSNFAISNDSKYFAFSDLSNYSVKVFGSKGYPLYNTKQHKNKNDYSVISDIKIIEEKGYLISLGSTGEAYITNIETGELIRELYDKEEETEKIVVSNDRSLIAICYFSKNATIFNIETGEIVERVDGEIFSINSKKGKVDSISGQRGQILFEKIGDKVELYASNDDRKGLSNREFNDDYVSVDNKYLLTSITNGSLVITDLKTGNRVRTLDTKGNYNSRAVMSSDLNKIAYGAIDDYTYISDFHSIEELQKMAKEVLNNRKLSEIEKSELGIIERINENE